MSRRSYEERNITRNIQTSEDRTGLSIGKDCTDYRQRAYDYYAESIPEVLQRAITR